MVRKEPKFRKRLSEKQLRIVKLIYKFRFISAPLLCEVLEKSSTSVYTSLSILVDQGYVGKRHDKSFRLSHTPAIYYLDNKGIALLREEDHPAFTEKSLRNMYKNKNMKMNMTYVNKCLRLMELYIALKGHYKETFIIFTKFELGAFEEFPSPPPDFYLRRSKPVEGKVTEFMLTLLEPNMPYFIHIKQLRRYQTHEEEEGWNTDYPYVLLVAPTDSVEKRLLKTIENTSQEFEFYTSTFERLTSASSKSASWADAFEENTLVSLNSIEP